MKLDNNPGVTRPVGTLLVLFVLLLGCEERGEPHGEVRCTLRDGALTGEHYDCRDERGYPVFDYNDREGRNPLLGG